ncbi:MAG: histidine kinase, partial [Nitrospira sp.]|nr:histidine kinase [Nitrospira sp.]
REGIGALAFIPLTAAAEERLLGKLMLYARSPHVWSEANIRLAQLIADHLVSALLRIEAEQTLRQTYKEREQICHDVHDGILQSLYSVGLLLEVAKRELVHEGVGEAVPSVAGSLEKAVSHLNTVIGEVRRFLEHLKNGSVADQRTDVVQALDELLTAVQSVDPIPIERRLMVRRPLLLPADQVAHLRLIVKEALSNSLRHSHAARRWVALQRRRSGVRLEVGDDGIGFDRRLKKRHGEGLSSMASRAELIGGRLTIRTRRGRGTRVMLELPCAGGAEPLAFHERPVMSVTESRAGGGDPLVAHTPRDLRRTSFSRLAVPGR